MEKLYDRIDFNNNTTPALNETNLNAMSKAIDDIDDRVIEIAGDVLVVVPEILDKYADIEALTTNPPYIGQNGHWWTWDTDTNQYVDSGVDAGVSVTVGSTTTLPAGSDATVTNVGTDTDPILNFGIPQGATGQNGADGVGVPSGGTTGQVLKKVSGTDYDTEWANESGGGSGGHTIINSAGTDMTQRAGLQFEGMGVTDDSVNDKTVVTLPTPDYVDAQYDPNHYYVKGETCISGNVRYRYKSSTSTKGNMPPNATYWEVLSVASQLAEGSDGYNSGYIDVNLTNGAVDVDLAAETALGHSIGSLDDAYIYRTQSFHTNGSMYDEATVRSKLSDNNNVRWFAYKSVSGNATAIQLRVFVSSSATDFANITKLRFYIKYKLK